jgi:superfamily II DNA helicase RecQ
VGITRARTHLFLSWPREARSAPSPFLTELGVAHPPVRHHPSRGPAAVRGSGPLFERLKGWRRERAKADGVPAYVVFHDATLAAIAQQQPRSRASLACISGVGPAKLERYADEVLELVARSQV